MQAAEIERNILLSSRLCGKWQYCHEENTQKAWGNMVSWLDGASDGLPEIEIEQTNELITLFEMALEHKDNASK